jgi:hypothetical protein
MTDTRRYWDGNRWTDQVAPIDLDSINPSSAEGVANGVLKAVFVGLLVVTGAGILVMGLATTASTELNAGVVAGILLIGAAIACVFVAFRSSSSSRKPRTPWAWWEVAIVTGLGVLVLVGLVEVDQDRQRDDKLEHIACESAERLYGESGDC